MASVAAGLRAGRPLGDFTPGDDKPKDGEPRNWILAGGLGWLYGMGVCVGPFFGVGVGLSFPGGVIAGAGGGVGVVVGIGMSGGLVWGTGRGQVSGFGVPTPMAPPQLPSLAELRRGATTRLEALRTDFGRSGGRRLKATSRGRSAAAAARAGAAAPARAAQAVTSEIVASRWRDVRRYQHARL